MYLNGMARKQAPPPAPPTPPPEPRRKRGAPKPVPAPAAKPKALNKTSAPDAETKRLVLNQRRRELWAQKRAGQPKKPTGGAAHKPPAKGATRRRAPPQGKPARPTILTEELGDKILSRLSSGELLIDMVKDETMPEMSLIQKWARDDEDFGHSFARAREEQSRVWIEEARSIADRVGTAEETLIRETTTSKGVKITTREVRKHADIEGAKLRIHTRLQIASRVINAGRPKSSSEDDRPGTDSDDDANELRIVVVGGLPRRRGDRGGGEP